MFYSFVYIFIIAAVIFALVAIYNIYCGISFIKYKKDVKKDGNNTNTRYNLYAIIHRAIHKKDLTKRLKLYLWIIWINAVRTVGTAIAAALLAVILYQMNIVFNNMGSILTTIFQKDCEVCYVKCSNNVENDEKLAYELLFGPDSCNAFITSLNFNDNQLSIYNSLPTIKEKSEYICDYLKEYNYDLAIAQYKKDLETIGTDFRIKVDHIDRKDLGDAELRDDLIALLSDYKVNGKNTRCKCCSNGSDILLKIKCQGHEQWKEGWKFKSISENDTGGGEEDDNNSGLGPRHQMGQATGTYAIQLDDGMYYWYHQSSPACGCTYCGTWTERHWSLSGTGGSKFGSDGCAVYSLAIGISNLMGQEITPDKIFDALESPYTATNVRTNQAYFIGVGIKRGEAVKKLSETFGFHYTPVADSVAEWDEILNKGGIIWTSWKDSLCPWCGNGSRHFMCIRKTDGTNYYCFTSCRGKCATSSSKAGAIQTMNYPIEKNSCIAMLGNEDGRQAYGLWADPPSGGGGNLSSDAEIIYNKLVGNYPEKAKAMAQAYSKVAPILGTNAAIGLMANIVSEGNYRVVEYAFSSNHAYGFTLPSGGSTIESVADLDYLLAWDSVSRDGNPKKGSCGVGSVQWSFDRRIGICNVAKTYMTTDGDCNDINWGIAEAEWMATELAPGSSYYNSVSRAMSSLSDNPEDWAEAMCDYYIRPSGCCGSSSKMTTTGSACQTRRQAATTIASILR